MAVAAAGGVTGIPAGRVFATYPECLPGIYVYLIG